MALAGTGSVLAQAIVAGIAAVSPPAATDPKTLQVWTAVSEAIIAHFLANAQTLHAPGTIAVQGTAAAQANVVPIQGSLL